MLIKNNSKEPRISSQSLRVLRVFIDNPSTERSGSELLILTKLASGTLYPILLRFEKAGWLQSQWEDIDPSEAQRPRKRFYRITPSGLAKASSEFEWLAEGVFT